MLRPDGIFIGSSQCSGLGPAAELARHGEENSTVLGIRASLPLSFDGCLMATVLAFGGSVTRCRHLFYWHAAPLGETGTHFFPAIAVRNPGQVDVAYLRTPEIIPTDALGKADPGGCAGPGPANGNPTTYSPTCSWNLYAAQSLNLTSSPSSATWATTQITTTTGSSCNESTGQPKNLS